MMNFKNSKTAKAISGIVGVATAVMMMGPAVASAATVEELTAQINALLAQVAALQASTSSTPAASCSASFTMNLKQGMSNAEVMALQKVLNKSADTQVAVSGAGSPGNETSYFGPATKAAVIKFQDKNAAAILTPVGLTKGTGFVGASTRALLNASCSSTSSTTTTTTTTGTGVSATLDTTVPMSTLISPTSGTILGTVAAFKLTNAGSAAAKVTAVKFTRTGISSDTTLSNVYLYSGATRLTDAGAVSTGVASFNDANGIVTIPAMSSVTILVRGDVTSGQSNKTLGMMLTDVTTDAGAVTGLPVSGPITMILSAPTDMATASFTGATTPAAGLGIDPQSDYIVWQNSVTIGSRDVTLSSIRFQQIGSVYNTDITNFRLMVDGTQVGTAVAQADANRYVTFAFPTPVVVKAGTHVLKLEADIVGGSNRNFLFSIRRAVDVEMWDSQLNIAIPVTTTANSSTSFPINVLSAISINTGTLSLTKSTASPSGNVALQASGVTLAKFDIKSNGEDLKVENLGLSFYTSGSATTIRNGAVFFNGVQVGSTQSIGNGTATTTFNLGSSMILKQGVNNTLEVRGDVNVASGTNFAANNTLTVNIAAGSSNVYRQSSLSYTANSAVSGNQLTVASGSLATAKYSAYANQTVVVPQTAYKVGDYRVTTGSTEGVNVDTLSVDFTGSTDITKLQDVYVVYGSKTSQTKATVASTSNIFTVNESVAANATLNVAVYATLKSNATGVVTTLLTVSGTSPTSGNSVSATQTQGQTITVGSGVLASAVDASTPISAQVVANSMPKVASFKFTSSNDAFIIDEITTKVTSVAAGAAVKNIVLKDGATTLATQPLNGTNATSSGLSIAVGINGTKIIDVYADLGSIGTGFASTSANVGVTLDGFEYMNSNGEKSYDATDRVGNSMYAYKTKPTIINAALPATILSPGTMTIGKVTITADAGGTVAWRKMVFTIATSTPSGSFSVTNPTLVDDSGTAIAGITMVPSAGLAGTITASSTAGAADQEVSGSKTYTLKATIGGSPVTGSSVTTNIASSGAGYVASTDATTVAGTAATFVWSDESSSPHSALTQDWNNDAFVKNIPTDSQPLSK